MNIRAQLPPGETTSLLTYEEGTPIHVPSLLHAIWQGRLWILFVPVILAVAVGFWTIHQPPEYSGRATMLMDGFQGAPAGFLAQQVAAAAGLGATQTSIDTDLLILESRRLVEGVVDSLGLRVTMHHPRARREQVLDWVEADRSDLSGTVTFTALGSGQYSVIFEPDSEAMTPSQRVLAAGDTLDLGGVRIALSESAQPELIRERIELVVVPFRRSVERFIDDLTVTREGQAAVVAVEYRNSDPVLAAAGANALVERFVAYRLETSHDAARGASRFLRDQVVSSARQLQEAEARLQAFREREAVFSPQQAAGEQFQRVTDLDEQRAELVAQRDVLAELVREAESAAGADRTDEYRRLAAYPEFFRNPAVQNILESLVQLENDRADLLIRRTESNADVRGLTERIAELEQQLLQIANNFLASLREQIVAIDRSRAATSTIAARSPALDTEFNRLLRDVEILNQIHNTLQLKLKEQEVTEADERRTIRTLDAALVPLRPSAPRPVLSVALALIVGSMLGLGIAIGRAVFDRALYSKEVVAAVVGSVPILSSIPAAAAARPRLLPPRTFGRVAVPASGGIADPGTATEDAYASLCTRLSSYLSPAPQVLLVTSPREGDGKSTVAVNLTAAFARHGLRAILLEADLRKGDIQRMLGLPTQGGSLAEALSEQASLDDAVVTRTLPGTVDAGFDVILGGNAPRLSTTLLDSSAFSSLIGELRKRYDRIVIDTPPLGVVADALLAGRRSDGALLVTRAGATDRAGLEDAMVELERVGVTIHGLVLNGFSSASSAGYPYGRS